jgi:hypothetical protein
MAGKAQKELDRLHALDAALDEDQVAADIDKVLNQKQSFSLKPNVDKNTSNHNFTSISNEEVPAMEKYYEKKDPNITKTDEQRSTPNPMITDPERAPETADRYAKAKLLMMTKQLTDAADLRQKMEDHIKDLQHQLKNSRDENALMKKRYFSYHPLFLYFLNNTNKQSPTARVRTEKTEQRWSQETQCRSRCSTIRSTRSTRSRTERPEKGYFYL